VPNELPREFGRFKLIEKLGMGGMGEVYLAKIIGPDRFEREVAVKLILPHLSRDESFRELCSQEARLAATLHHPNIVSVYEYGRIDDTDYLLMEYVNGTDLRTMIRRIEGGDQMPEEIALLILHRIARGLDYAHSIKTASGNYAGIIHQDLSPHNILISTAGEVKIADFGIAKALADETPESSSFRGKASYMSPEQVDGREIDHRTDLFSLGTLAYQLLAGKHPFLGSTREDTLRAVSKAQHTPLHEAGPLTQQAVSDAVEDLLALLPEDRPENTSAMTEALEPHFDATAERQLGEYASEGRKPSSRELTSLTAPTLARPIRSKFPFAASGLILLVVFTLFMLLPGGTSERSGSAESKMPGPASENSASRVPELSTMRIVTEPPGADLMLNDKPAGKSPAELTLDPADSPFDIRAQLYGYKTAENRLKPETGQSEHTIQMIPLPVGSVPVNAIPWARVYHDGELINTTPVVLENLPVGEREITLRNEILGIDKTVTITVLEGKNDPILVRMGD